MARPHIFFIREKVEETNAQEHIPLTHNLIQTELVFWVDGVCAEDVYCDSRRHKQRWNWACSCGAQVTVIQKKCGEDMHQSILSSFSQHHRMSTQ